MVVLVVVVLLVVVVVLVVLVLVVDRGDWSNQESLEPQIELDRKLRCWKVVLVQQ